MDEKIFSFKLNSQKERAVSMLSCVVPDLFVRFDTCTIYSLGLNVHV